MARLLDDLLYGRTSCQLGPKFRQLLAEAMPIVADDVTEYFFAVSDKERWHMDRDFPNIAPSFQAFFIETKPPTKLRSTACEEKLWKDVGQAYLRPLRWGVFFRTGPTNQLWDVINNPIKAHHGPDIRWCLIATLFLDVPAIGGVQAIWEWLIAVRADGSVFATKEVETFNGEAFSSCGISFPLVPGLADEFWKGQVRDPERFISYKEEATNYLHPLLLAICFMHCKNVELVPERQDLRLARKRAKAGRPLLRYSSIEITPLKKVLEASRQGGDGSLKNAVHICRGHFKHYTAEKPLLGRHVGSYFWNDHVRGRDKEHQVLQERVVKHGG